MTMRTTRRSKSAIPLITHRCPVGHEWKSMMVNARSCPQCRREAIRAAAAEMPKRFELLLQSDSEVDPDRIVLTVHPNHYNEVAAMIRAGLLLKGEPQAIDAEEWAEVRLLAAPAASTE
jgi:hypothetical protein